MITRRGFLARLAAAPIVALALPKAPVAEAEWGPVESVTEEDWYADQNVVDNRTGISIRYVRQFDAVRTDVKRLDCLVGYGNLAPEFAVRTMGYTWWSPRRWFA